MDVDDQRAAATTTATATTATASDGRSRRSAGEIWNFVENVGAAYQGTGKASRGVGLLASVEVESGSATRVGSAANVTRVGSATPVLGNVAAGKGKGVKEQEESGSATRGKEIDNNYDDAGTVVNARASKRRKVPNETAADKRAPLVIRQESMQDSILPLDIETLTQQLDYSVLTMPDHNEQLKDALDRDSEIIDKVETRIGINKCCEHGVKLSTIIKAKALRLNEAAVLDVLNGVIQVLKSNFSKPAAAAATANENNDANGVLDFVLLSKRFSSKVLATSTLDWSTLPLPRGNALAAGVGVARQPRSRCGINSLVASVPSRILVATQDVIQSANEALGEDGNLSTTAIGDGQGAPLDYKSFCNHLYKTCSQGPVAFWPMILDADPVNGFNNTTMALYALTHATIKGDAKFTISTLEQQQQQRQQQQQQAADVQISARENVQGIENGQGIISGWSFETWQQLCQTYRAA